MHLFIFPGIFFFFFLWSFDRILLYNVDWSLIFAISMHPEMDVCIHMYVYMTIVGPTYKKIALFGVRYEVKSLKMFMCF